MKTNKMKRILSALITLSLVFSLMSASAYAAHSSDDSLDLAEVEETMQEAIQLLLNGGTTDDVYELYYQAGYLTREEIREFKKLEEEYAARPVPNAVVGDVEYVDVTIYREDVEGLRTATAVADVIADVISRVAPTVPLGTILSVLSGLASLILDKLLEDDWDRIEIEGEFRYVLNADNATTQWLPYAFKYEFV